MSAGTLARSGRPGSTAPAPIDPRLRARRIEVERDRGRRRLRRIVSALAIVVVAAAALAVLRSPLLDVDHVRVGGVEGARRAEVSAAADVQTGTPMIELDAAAVVRRVESLPWVLDARVERSWHGTIGLSVTERTAIAVDHDGSGLDAAGRSIGPVDAAGLPTIVGASVAPGSDLSPALAPVLEVLDRVPDGLRGEVESGTVTEGDAELLLTDGIRVRFGPSDRHRAKFEALEALLEQGRRSSIRAIDVRVPSSPSLTRRAGSGA